MSNNNLDHSTTYYYRPATPRSKEGVGTARYIHRARQVKANDPQGIYAAFNLSNNKGLSDKPSIHKGSALIG